mgnify:CR=1 FL=1
MKIRSVETALRADVSQNVPNGVDALGIFDNLVQPIFPFPLENLSIILSFSEMEGPTMYQIRVNAPNDDLISKGDFGVLPDQFGYGRKVVNLGGILITERGKYTVDIFEIGADNKLKFIKTKRLFNADYPPQREISDAEKEAILADEKLIRMVKTEFKPFEFANDESVKPVKLQISLDNSVPVEEGYIAFPEDNTIEIKGKKFDLTGMRRHVEWMFGRPIPRAEEETPNEEKEEENMISDPLLASFIDENNEIVVKDTLYKFTTRGVFSSHLKDSLKLKSYLKDRQPQLSAEELLKLRETASGKRQVADGVYRFIAPISELERNNIKEEQKRIANLTPANELQPIIDGLPITRGDRNWFLHRIFGESRVATEHFDRRHRVKIEFFNQNYGFYKSVGISVRNQTRRFRIWWASKANEVVLGINYIYMTYKMPTAPLKELQAAKDENEFIILAYKGDFYFHAQNNYLKSTFKVEEAKLPFIKYNNEKLLTIYIPSVAGYKIDYEKELFVSDLLSQKNIATLYKMGFDFLRNIGSKDKEFAVVRTPQFEDEIEAMYFAERYQGENTNKKKIHLSTDYGFLLTFTSSVDKKGGKWYNNFGVKPPELREYKTVKYDFYGMARVGGTWRGVRMVYEK